MKKVFLGVAFVFSGSLSLLAQAPKIISDCTVYYSISVDDPKADAGVIKSMAGATKVLYLQNKKSRTDLIAAGYKQSTITNTKSDTVIVLRELGSTKYLSYVDDAKRIEQNKQYQGMQVISTDEKKTILGYDCKKVVAKLTDGSTYNVFYTPSIAPSNKEYEYQFKDLPGFVLEYDSQSVDGKTKVKYSATKIILEPVPAALFDSPKSGYRVL